MYLAYSKAFGSIINLMFSLDTNDFTGTREFYNCLLNYTRGMV